MRAALALTMTGLAVSFSGAALAEGASLPCYDLIPAQTGAGAHPPLLIDKCSGRTWLLSRQGRASYRWTRVAADEEKAKTSDRIVPDRTSTQSPAGQDKCFTFNGRRFCE